MTRTEIENALFDHMYAIRDLVKAYYPSDEYLTMSLGSDGYISFNNSYWTHEGEGKISAFENNGERYIPE